LRFARQFTRGVVLTILTLASIATAVAGVFTVSGPPSLPLRLDGSVWLSGNAGSWDMVLYLNRFHDESIRVIARQNALRLHVNYKINPGEGGTYRHVSVGPIEFDWNPAVYVTLPCERGELPDSASDEERARWLLHDAKTWIAVPFWLPAPLFAAYPFWAFVRGPWRRRRRKAKGLCLRCGYDLTGNVTGVCSECGRSVR